MSSIKDRVVQVLETQKIPKESFFKSIGMTSSNFRGDAKKTPLNSDAIANILSKLPQINALWLLTGDGEMECSVNKTTQVQMDVLEKIYSLFEIREQEHKVILSQNSEIIRQNSDIIKQNSEVMRQNGELIRIVTKFIDK